MVVKVHPSKLALLLALGWLLLAAWLYRGLFMDDAYIGFRYVDNLLAGRGFVFNPGARVEGVTDAGWLLLLTPVAAWLGPLSAAKTAGFLLLAATVVLTRIAAAPATRLGPPVTVVPILTVLTTAFHAELVAFALLGMETALLAVVVLALVILAERRRFAWLPVLGTFAFLVHPEAALVAPLGAVLAWRAGALPGRAALRIGAGCGIGLLGVSLIRWLYFGALLPNTFAAKPATGSGLGENLLGFALGPAVNVGFPFAGCFAAPLVFLGWRTLRRAAPLTASFAAAASLTGLAFALYARPDWTELARYFAPYAPATFLLLWTGACEAERAVVAGNRSVRAAGAAIALTALLGGIAAFVLLGWLELRSIAWIGLALLWVALTEAARRWGRAGIAAPVLAVVVALSGAVATVELTTERSRSSFPGYVLTSRTLVGPSHWMRDHLPAGASIATRRIGALAYGSGHPVFDYSFGLTEPAVARLIRRRGHVFETPADPALARLWRERAPDYILEDRSLLDQIAAASGGTAKRFRVHGLEYGAVIAFPIARGVDWVLARRLDTTRTVL